MISRMTDLIGWWMVRRDRGHIAVGVDSGEHLRAILRQVDGDRTSDPTNSAGDTGR